MKESGFDPQAVIAEISIPQCSNLTGASHVLSLASLTKIERKPRGTPMANDERDDNIAGIEMLMRDIRAQIERIASYVDELRRKGER
jgi:hypothetical protein